MSNWTKIEYDNPGSQHVVVLTFATEDDALDFVSLAKIGRDVDDELLLYGNGVLRTLSLQKKEKNSKNARKVHTGTSQRRKPKQKASRVSVQPGASVR